MFRGPLPLDKFESDVDYVFLIFGSKLVKVNLFIHINQLSTDATI